MSEKSDWEQGYDQAMRRTYDERIDARKRIAELESRIAELENEHNVWLVGATNEIDRLTARIAELEGLVDELVDSGDNLFDSLNPIAWKHEWLDKWWKLSTRIRKEREK